MLDAEGGAHQSVRRVIVRLPRRVEPQALKGFDIDRFKPSLVCVEGLLPVRQQILDYFARHGYVLVGKYMWVDLENMYFTPVDGASSRP